MHVSLGLEAEKLLDRRMSRGGYATAEEVVLAGLTALEQQDDVGDVHPDEFDRLLAEGEASGEPLDGDEVFDELREIRVGGNGKAG